MYKIFDFQVVDIMKTNVEKVLERDQKLSELDDRAGKTSDSLTVLRIGLHYTYTYLYECCKRLNVKTSRGRVAAYFCCNCSFIANSNPPVQVQCSLSMAFTKLITKINKIKLPI